jgi:hypothetical protein
MNIVVLTGIVKNAVVKIFPVYALPEILDGFRKLPDWVAIL